MFTNIFYVIDKNEKIVNVTLKIFNLIKKNIIMYYENKIWKHNVNYKKLKLMKFEKLIKKIQNKTIIYAIIIWFVSSKKNIARINVATTFHLFDIVKTIEFTKIFVKYKKYENVFSNQQIREFFEYKFNNYVINTKNAKSSFELLYNLSTIKLIILRNYLNDLLNKNWIYSLINFAKISILFIFKKNDTLRLCVDYRKLNRIIKKNRHSLSFIFQVLNEMTKNKYFTKINLQNDNHQIKINKKNDWKTTFCTRYEHFEFLMMFFELINVSTTFQIHVNKTLKNLINIVYIIYLNDILIFSKNRESHVKNVTIVLRKLKKFRLYVKLKKCFFLSMSWNI